MERKVQTKTLKGYWDRYKFVLLIVLVGVILLAWPFGSHSKTSDQNQSQSGETTLANVQSLKETEEQMEKILSQIDGVGNLQLMLTVESAGEKQLAQDTELSYSGETTAPDEYSRKSDTVVLSGDNGDAAVVTKNISPTYRGALVVCQGAENASVKLAVTQAVAALTGLSSDRITVVKCQ